MIEQFRNAGLVSRSALRWALVLVLSVTVCGCEGIKHEKQREQAEQRWGEVRARIKHQLATQQYESGQIDAAVLTAREALGLNPDFLDSYLLLARALLEQGNWAGAQQTLSVAQARDLESADLHYLWGMMAERAQDYEAALVSYQQARNVGPDDKDFVAAEAECLVALGRPEEARLLISGAIDLFDRDGYLETLLAEVSLMVGDEAAAAAAFAQAMPMVGHDPLVAETYGLLLCRMNRRAEAIAILQPLVERQGDEAVGSVVLSLAQCYVEVGQNDAAHRLLNRWLQRNPSDAVGWLLQARNAMQRGDLITTRRCAEAARRLVPHDSGTHLAHAYVCWQSGDLRRAVASLRQALKLDDEDALGHCLMAEVLLDGGRVEEARSHWQRALQITPDADWARAGLERVERESTARLTGHTADGGGE